MKQIISTVATVFFILLFVYTGVSKLLSVDSFEKVLSDSVLVRRFSVLVSWLLPVVELVVAGLLVFPDTKKVGMYISLLLMVLFTAYIGWMLLYEPQLPCSCGGIIKYMSWKSHFIFNLACIVLAIAGIRTIPGGSKPKTRRVGNFR